MYDPLFVRRVEGFENLLRVFDGFFERQRAFERSALDRTPSPGNSGPTS